MTNPMDIYREFYKCPDKNRAPMTRKEYDDAMTGQPERPRLSHTDTFSTYTPDSPLALLLRTIDDLPRSEQNDLIYVLKNARGAAYTEGGRRVVEGLDRILNVVIRGSKSREA